jgi:hypothetical protein
MSHARAMLDTHPRLGGTVPVDVLADVLHALDECTRTCTLCADACLTEEMVDQLRRCIGLNLDCAGLCRATGDVLSRQVEPNQAVLRATLEACAAACTACGAECASHAEMHEHCRVCAESCQRCEDACRRTLAALG